VRTKSRPAGARAWHIGPLALLVATVGLALALPGTPVKAQENPARCPAEMVRVRSFCIDRWEMSTVDKRTGNALSPYYPPTPRELVGVFDYWMLERKNFGDAAAREFPLPELPEWQRQRTFSPRAVSRPGVVPQAYVSYHVAKRACEAAGKRLCTEKEWVQACGGERGLKFPYGERYQLFSCNVHRPYHPAFVLHGNSSLGHRDPRLNLVVESDRNPLLRLTGATPKCASTWNGDAIYDMVGNLDEWVEGEKAPAFVGGFYARSTTKGCEAIVDSHAPAYYDYSTGARCCKAAPAVVE
jgi:formylglycine-generating enzyme required for sulfatase activity